MFDSELYKLLTSPINSVKKKRKRKEYKYYNINWIEKPNFFYIC